MPIRTEDVKIKASQRLTDNEDGGGYMTSRVIVDGAINNLFTDISRLDRTYGRVSLRKSYLHVDTDDTDMYSGAHVIISKLASDPNVRIALFSTSSDADVRADAKDRLESYVTLGPRFIGWLWGDQPQGARQILIFMPTKQPSPEVNDVLCLFNNRGTANEFRQFVRIIGIEERVGSFSVGSRKILTITIGDPLLATFTGMEIHANDSAATNIHTTTVTDSSHYYGVMRPTADIAAGDMTINVDDIYTQLVPTSQTETALLDQTPTDVGPIEPCGETVTLPISGFSGTVLHLWQSPVPGTLDIRLGSRTYTDNGSGVLFSSGSQAGIVDYGLGRVTFTNAVSGSGQATFDPGAALSLTPTTLMLQVPTSGQGYTYVGICWPPPLPGTISADYLVDGRWYRLRDDGAGLLVPDIEDTGTGRVNYESGQIALTCAAIPDADSGIILSWGNPTEIVQLAGNVDIAVEPLIITLAQAPAAPNSLVIEWPSGLNTTARATDDGHGRIIGDAEGWINYGTGELEFRPKLLPVAGSEYSVDYERYALRTETHSGPVFTLANVPKEGTLALEVTCSPGGRRHTYKLQDMGDGTLAADGFTETLSQSRNESSDVVDKRGTQGNKVTAGSSIVENETESNTTIVAGGIGATVDYVTGQVVIDLTTAVSETIAITANAKSTTKESANKTQQFLLGGSYTYRRSI